jgi:hypothetical protein
MKKSVFDMTFVLPPVVEMTQVENASWSVAETGGSKGCAWWKRC